MNRIITILVLSFLSMSCCRKESKMVEELTMEELKTMLETDTANVKELIFYSQCLVLKKSWHKSQQNMNRPVNCNP
ncbi:MAG: hypothetical protein IKT84_05195 [Bacteroidales bacterium]|nr:hypothetical protein [Bacteroidales bacterium]